MYAGLWVFGGHAGSSDKFFYYWPEQYTTLIGTLNQLDCERKLYDNVALIMNMILTCLK